MKWILNIFFLILITSKATAQLYVNDTSVVNSKIYRIPILAEANTLQSYNSFRAIISFDIRQFDIKEIGKGNAVNDLFWLEPVIIENENYQTVEFGGSDFTGGDTLAFLVLESLANKLDSSYIYINELQFDEDENLKFFEVDSALIINSQPLSFSRGTFFSKPYPNPFQGEVNFDVSVVNSSFIDIYIEDMASRKTLKLSKNSPLFEAFLEGKNNIYQLDQEIPEGFYKLKLRFKSARISAGLYRVNIIAGNTRSSQLVMYIK